MTAETWRLPLPYPVPPLRDNDRMHWAPKAAHVKQLRGDARLLAMSAKLPKGLERVRIELHWVPTVRRQRDHLSIAPTLKPLVDGLVDYGLVPDDDIGHVELGCVIEPIARNPRVWLTITDLAAVAVNDSGTA